MIRTFCFAVLLMLAAGIGAVAESGAPSGPYRVPLMAKVPIIDGKIDPAEWAGSAGFDGFGFDILGQRRVQAWVGADENTLYFAIRSQLPEEGSLSATQDPSLSSLYYSEDTVSLHILPNPEAHKYAQYHILANSLGFCRYRTHLRNGAIDDPGWHGNWKQVGSLHDGWWEWECAVPISSMPAVAKGRKTTDGTWQINLSRDFKGPMAADQSLSCQADVYGFSEGGRHMFSGVTFRFVREMAPAVQYLVGSDPFLTNFKGTLSILNPSATPLELEASIFIDRDRMPEITAAKKFTLAPGQKEEVVVVCPPDESTTAFQQRTTVKSADGKTVYYDRSVKWPKASQYHYIGATVHVKPDPMKVEYAYYPYKNKMRVAVDISDMPKDAAISKLTAIVREAGGNVIKDVDFPLGQFKNGRQEQSFGLPELKGQYELVVKPEGTNPTAQIVKQFERTVYEWEHNKLGLSTKVYPPFTPIEVDGKSLSTVLRVHTLNDVGLLDQVTGKSAQTGVVKPMLASPMRYVAVMGGKEVKVKAAPLKTISSQQNEVTTEAAFSAGDLRAVARDTWDYDGTVKVELTLLPTGGKQVDEFTLEIPLDAKVATMIHANADRIRAPVAQMIPQGKGIVWDASRVATNDWPKTFCPYIYLGDAVRGLCWFTENDKGWSWDSNTPNLDVVRRGKEVLLRIYLINKPVVITEPRTITFGLLAAPVKPRVTPNANPNSWRYGFVRNRYDLLGTDINWLALGNCSSVYPAGKDMYLWEMIARGNVEHLSDDQVRSVIAKGKKYFEPYPDWEKAFEVHAWHNLTGRYGEKMIFYYNRASYQACEEFQTFKDEWVCTDMRSVDKGSSIEEIKTVPCPSYLDYCMYWYDKSFDIGRNQGAYWDNLFTISTRNTEMTDAYKLDDRTVRPASSIWELRDLVKRTFVLMNERGMLPVTFPHMTSFNPLPMMSFSTFQLDWEWRYSSGEVQDRFPREYLLLASNGDLAGVWPVPLGEHGSQENDPWIKRTFLAVRLVHELDGGPVPQPILDILDKPGLDVFRYWDERPLPVTTHNPDVPTLVYSVPGKEALALVVSYSAKDENLRVRIDPKVLGFTGEYTVSNAEKDDEPLQLKGNALSLALKKHDMAIIRLKVKDVK